MRGRSGLIEAVGLVLLGAAQSLPVAIVGAMAMGAAFSLLFPSLSLLAVNRVTPERRGAAMGTFTASFDLGMLVGSPAVGVAAAASAATAPPSMWRGLGARLRRARDQLHRGPGAARARGRLTPARSRIASIRRLRDLWPGRGAGVSR